MGSVAMSKASSPQASPDKRPRTQLSLSHRKWNGAPKPFRPDRSHGTVHWLHPAGVFGSHADSQRKTLAARGGLLHPILCPLTAAPVVGSKRPVSAKSPAAERGPSCRPARSRRIAPPLSAQRVNAVARPPGRAPIAVAQTSARAA